MTMWRRLARSFALFGFLRGVTGYGTTVYIAESYCPTTTSLATGAAGPTGVPASTPYLIYVIPQPTPQLPKRDANSLYIAADGTITADAGKAAQYRFDGSGRLSVGGSYISTTGAVAYGDFAPSKLLGAINTLFTLSTNNTLSWTSDTFSPHNARFCSFTILVQAIFTGEYPQGCNPVQLGLIEVTKANLPSISTTLAPITIGPVSVNVISSTIRMSSTISKRSTQVASTTASPSSPIPGSVQGALALANSIDCIFSDEVSPAVGSQGSYQTVSTLEECVDYCAVLLAEQCLNLPFVGIEAGSHCYCGTSYTGAPAPGTCSILCPGDPAEICGDVTAMNVYQIVSRTPNALTLSCSPAATSPTPTGSAYPAPTSTGQPNCMDGSAFDGTVNNNYLILCDTSLPGYDLAKVDAVDLGDCIDQCSSAPPQDDGSVCVAVEYDILVSDKPCSLKYNVGTVTRGSNPFAQAAIVVDEPGSPSISFDAGSTSTTSISLTLSTTMAATPITKSSTTPTNSVVSTLSQALPTSVHPTTSLTPQNPISSTSPAVFSSVATPAPIQSTSPHTASSVISPSMASSLGMPTTPNILTSRSIQSSSAPISTSVGPGSSAAQALSNPISAVSTSPLSTSTASSSQVAPSSAFTTAAASSSPPASFSLFTSSTSRGLVVYPTPTASLCPNYNHQVLNVNSDNYNYEIECSTTLNGAVLVGNSSVATSLSNCLRFCTIYNVALPFQCLGVNYVLSAGQGNINCYLMSSITGTTCLTSFSAGRLVYDGYPAIADADCLASSTSAPTSSTVALTSSTITTSRIVPPSSSMTTTPTATIPATTPTPRSATTLSISSTSSVSTSACPAAPTANTECVPSVSTPQCYSYPIYSNNLTPSNVTENWEVECATTFSGATLQATLTQSLADCLNYCQFANSLTPNSCIGVTYINGDPVQGGPNNCNRYTTVTCAKRGNSTFDSARILNGAYPAMVDYASSFNCP